MPENDKQLKVGEQVGFELADIQNGRQLLIEGIIKTMELSGSNPLILLKSMGNNYCFQFFQNIWVLLNLTSREGVPVKFLTERNDFPSKLPELDGYLAFEAFAKGEKIKGAQYKVSLRYLVKVRKKIVEAGIGWPIGDEERLYWLPSKWYSRNKEGKWFYLEANGKIYEARIKKEGV